MRLTFLCFIFLLFGTVQPAKATFVMDPNAIAAYNAIFDLRFADARKLIQEEKARNPTNGVTFLLEDDMDYLYILTSDNKNDYEKFKDRKSDRIDAIRDNDENSPYYLFCQADVYIHWGILKAKFGDYTSSVLDLNKARKLLAQNNEKFHDFLPNQKSLAWLDLLFGGIPSNLRGIASFFGIKGNLESGYKHLEMFKNSIAGTKFDYYNDDLIV